MDTVQIDTDESYAGLRDRDYFHIMLNLDSFDGFLPTARALAEGYLEAARKLQDDPGLEPELRAFPYSKAGYEARLDEVYQGFVDDVDRYEAARSWTMRTRDDVVEWILQMAPFNQTDGAWLRMIAPVGPVDEVRALLFAIYVDELGGGNPALNHPNVYTELMRSVGIDLPDIRSREYADNPALLDSAFTLPLFQLVVSQFPQDFFPELLGMTQYLEWSSVELKNMVLLHEHFGLDPHYYEMHVAIDNAATGHGAMARRAVELYLEQVRVDAGDEAMQEQWRRVWNGYVAFATTGTLAQEMAERVRRPSSPEQKVAAMVRERAPKARLNHGRKQLAGTLLNDLFADPPRLMTSLVDSAMVVAGDPERSPFFDLLTPDGPMYRIFTDAEIAIWKEWVRSLAGAKAAEPADPGKAPPTTGIAERMQRLVDAMRTRQDGTPAHQAGKLTGPDPADPARRTTQPVAWWFEQPAPALMRALAGKDNGWVTPGDAEASPFVTDLLRGRNAMARALADKAPDGSAWADIAVEWIDAGCPLPAGDLPAGDQPAGEPPAGDRPVRPLTLLSPPERVAAHPTGMIHGTGSVH
jgi:hypothetical protein